MSRQRRVLERRSLNTVWWEDFRVVKGIYVQPLAESSKKKALHASCVRGVGVYSGGSKRDGETEEGRQTDS